MPRTAMMKIQSDDQDSFALSLAEERAAIATAGGLRRDIAADIFRKDMGQDAVAGSALEQAIDFIEHN